MRPLGFLTKGMTIEAERATWTLFVLQGSWRWRLNGYAWILFDTEGMTGVGISREQLQEALLGITAHPAFEPYHPADQKQAAMFAAEIMHL